VKHFSVVSLWGRLQALPTNRLGYNVLPGTNTSLLRKFVNYSHISTTTLGPFLIFVVKARSPPLRGTTFVLALALLASIIPKPNTMKLFVHKLYIFVQS
jgi:hypothetical protein